MNKFLVVKIRTGLGKTEQALHHILKLIEQGHRIICSVPTHGLTDQVQKRITQIAGAGNIFVAVWRGREQANPDCPGTMMCRDLDLAHSAEVVLADPNATACRVCDLRDNCAYQKQRARNDVQFWVVPNVMLWRKMPRAMKGASLLIIDENFALGGLKGLEGRPILVTPEEIERMPTMLSLSQTADLVADLMPARRKLLNALRNHPPGPLLPQHLVDAGLTESEARHAYGLEWKRKIHVTVTANTTREGLQEIINRARGNRDVVRMAMLWDVIAALLADIAGGPSGWAQVVDQVDMRTGATFRAVQLFSRSDIGKNWAALPTLHLDATANMSLIKTRAPHAELLATIDAEEPFTRVIQYPTKSFSKASLAQDTKLDAVWFTAIAYAQQRGGQWLIVIQKEAEDRIRARHNIPRFIELAHHNAIAGRDDWRCVRGVIVIGRMAMPPTSAERTAAILRGRMGPIVSEWYPSETITLWDRKGIPFTVDVDRHPDPLADAVRQHACEDEIMQIIGRGRGINRTANQPLEVVVWTNVALPLVIDEFREWQPANFDEQMMAQHGMWLSSAGDAATVFGARHEAVKKARQRARTGTFPYRKSLYEIVPHLPIRQGLYQRDGVGFSEGTFQWDPRLVSDPESWLQERLGPLALFQLEPASDTATAPATSLQPFRIVSCPEGYRSHAVQDCIRKTLPAVRALLVSVARFNSPWMIPPARLAAPV